MLENRKIYGKILALMLAIFTVLQMAAPPVFAAGHKVTFHKSDGTDLQVDFQATNEEIGGGNNRGEPWEGGSVFSKKYFLGWSDKADYTSNTDAKLYYTTETAQALIADGVVDLYPVYFSRNSILSPSMGSSCHINYNLDDGKTLPDASLHSEDTDHNDHNIIANFDESKDNYELRLNSSFKMDRSIVHWLYTGNGSTIMTNTQDHDRLEADVAQEKAHYTHVDLNVELDEDIEIQDKMKITFSSYYFQPYLACDTDSRDKFDIEGASGKSWEITGKVSNSDPKTTFTILNPKKSHKITIRTILRTNSEYGGIRIKGIDARTVQNDVMLLSAAPGSLKITKDKARATIDNNNNLIEAKGYVDGFVIVTSLFSKTIDRIYGQNPVSIKFRNPAPQPDPKPEKPTEPILRIIKVDGDGNRINLPVTFKLTDKAYPTLPKTLVTDRDGQVAINSLSSGDYKLEEVLTPEGYAPLDKPIEFSVVAGSAVRYEGQVVRYIYVTNDKKSDTVKEITGDNRQDVAAEVSKNYFADAKKLILVQDMAYADSMSAMNISKGKYPILYVGQDSLYDVTKEEILRTGRDEIIVMGGENTISKRLFEEIKALNHGKVTRVDGLDRFEVNKNSLKYFGDYNKAVVASGMIYTDALSSVPYAHQENAPLLLTGKDSVPEILSPAFKAADEVVLAGGPNTVSEMGKAAIENLVGKAVTRIDGADRYVVSAKLAAMVNKADCAILTSGEKWSDALIAGPLAQKLNAPVLLSAKNALPGAINTYLTNNKDLKQILILGGPASIGEGVRSAVKALYK